MKRPNWREYAARKRDEVRDLRDTLDYQAKLVRERQAYANEYVLTGEGYFVPRTELQGELL